MKTYTLFAAAVILLSSCNKFYMPIEVKQPIDQSIEQFSKDGNPFIVHSPTGDFEAFNIRQTKDSMSFKPQALKGFKKLRFKRGKRVDYYYTGQPVRRKLYVEKEVHVFTTHPLGLVSDTVKSVPMSSITKVERLQFDKKKTTARHLVTAGIVTGAVAITFLLVFAASNPLTFGGSGTGVPLF